MLRTVVQQPLINGAHTRNRWYVRICSHQPNLIAATVIRSIRQRESHMPSRAPLRGRQGRMARCRMLWLHAPLACSCGVPGARQASAQHICMHARMLHLFTMPAQAQHNSFISSRKKKQSGQLLPAHRQRRSMPSLSGFCCRGGSCRSHASSTMLDPYLTFFRRARRMFNVCTGVLMACGWKRGLPSDCGASWSRWRCCAAGARAAGTRCC